MQLSKQNNFTKFPPVFQFMQNTAAKIRGHLQIFICHVHMQIRDLFVMFMSAPRYGKLSVGFQPIRIRENSTMNNRLISRVELKCFIFLLMLLCVSPHRAS
jgi:hypothetical protein